MWAVWDRWCGSGCQGGQSCCAEANMCMVTAWNAQLLALDHARQALRSLQAVELVSGGGYAEDELLSWYFFAACWPPPVCTVQGSPAPRPACHAWPPWDPLGVPLAGPSAQLLKAPAARPAAK